MATEDNASGGAAADEVVPVAGSVAAIVGVGAPDDSGHPVTLDVEGAPACAIKALSVVTNWLIFL